jgi:hypothetical protein
MRFRPSALSNPQIALRPMPGRLPGAKPRGIPGGIQVPQVIEGGDEGGGEEEKGLSMPAKVAIGAGVAAVLGLLVYRLVR